ncbi:hypothetical protein E2C01_078860 [Portunus trituberculatus]|uniref:Uncharacterized protein n=1 Tax=Portunus trituberculatus TaxID=210409 RepID=A0A5B7INZ1_PORTR|nr:hypothetical protein [Portunus trituberculatus]
MVPKRLISDENKESGESANVSEPQESQESHQEKCYKDVFSWMAIHPLATSPLSILLPSSSKLSITSLHLRYVLILIKTVKKKYIEIFINLRFAKIGKNYLIYRYQESNFLILKELFGMNSF